MYLNHLTLPPSTTTPTKNLGDGCSHDSYFTDEETVLRQQLAKVKARTGTQAAWH